MDCHPCLSVFPTCRDRHAKPKCRTWSVALSASRFAAWTSQTSIRVNGVATPVCSLLRHRGRVNSGCNMLHEPAFVAFRRLAHFVEVGMPLVNGYDPGLASAHVIKDAFCDMDWRAEPG